MYFLENLRRTNHEKQYENMGILMTSLTVSWPTTNEYHVISSKVMSIQKSIFPIRHKGKAGGLTDKH